MLFRSWGLFCSCWRVLRSQPTLAIYPIISGISSAIFVAVILIPLYFGGYLAAFIPTQPDMNEPQTFSWQTSTDLINWESWLVIFLLGLILNIVTHFLQRGLYRCHIDPHERR